MRPGAAALRPRVDVLVAVHEEGRRLAAKLDNLESLEYPPDRIRFWIVDGASGDDSLRIARARAARDERYRVLAWPVADKTAQLNAALQRARAEWVLVTDADALLPGDILARLLEAAAAVPGTEVVGATVQPARAHPLELLHWRWLNRMTLWEARVGSASIVTAPCYLFRRRLLQRLPEDVIADDVHVALAARAQGRRVGMIDADVVEMRAPCDLRALFGHKVRKGAAYIREVVRFLPRLRGFRGRDRVLFVGRAMQVLGVPSLLVLSGGAAAVALARAGLWREGLAAAAVAGVFVAGGAFLPAGGRGRHAGDASAVVTHRGAAGWGRVRRLWKEASQALLLLGLLTATLLAVQFGPSVRGGRGRMRRLAQPPGTWRASSPEGA